MVETLKITIPRDLGEACKDMNLIYVDNLETEELKLYSGASETELLRYYEPKSGLFIAESPNVIERALLAGYEVISFLMEERYISEVQGLIDRVYRTKEDDFPIYIAESECLQKITGFPMTRGMLALLRRKELSSIADICEGKNRIVILDDVMNPTNVGAIFRSAAALYMEGIILNRGCSDPLYRRASRVSMGTVFQIPWTIVEDKKVSIIDEVRALGFKTVAMALKEDSFVLRNERLQSEERLAIVMGSEGYGLSQETIQSCDYTVMIPMSNGVDSLNVAAASAVAFYELGRCV